MESAKPLKAEVEKAFALLETLQAIWDQSHDARECIERTQAVVGAKLNITIDDDPDYIMGDLSTALVREDMTIEVLCAAVPSSVRRAWDHERRRSRDKDFC